MELVSRTHLGWKRRITRELLPYGLNPKQIHVLRRLAESGGLAPSQIAELLYADRPSATSMLNTLERLGWITRKRDPRNRKQVIVEITKRGRTRLASVPEPLWRTGKVARDPAEALSVAERGQLRQLLDKLHAGIELERTTTAPIVDSGDPFPDAELERMARKQYLRGDAGFALVPARTALVVIDMQEEFVTPTGGPYRVPEAARRVPQVARLLDAFRRRGLTVVHTAFAETHGFRDRPRFGTGMPNRARDTGFDDSTLFRSARFVAGLEPARDEVVILKPSYGAFYDTPLETILKRAGVDTIVLAGTLTDCCVGTTARQAYERGFGAVVAADATATLLPEMQEAELCILRRSFARVLAVDDIIGELDRRGRSGIDLARSRAL